MRTPCRRVTRGRGSCSSPTVRPGWSAIARSPVSTPGVNEARSSESWRIVSVSPTPPRSTSWWATMPRIRRPWTRMPATSAPRAPSSAVLVASGHRPEPGLAAGGGHQLRRTPGGARRRVRLVGWCSSTISTDSKNGAACAGEAHHQDRADARSWGRSARRCRAGPPASRAGSSSRVLVEAGRADHRVDAVVDAELQVVHHHVGVGEVDDHLGAGGDQRRRCRRRRRPRRPARGRRPPRPPGTPRGRPCPVRAQHAHLRHVVPTT